MLNASMCAMVLASGVGSSAMAQSTLTPLAFGPLGPTDPGTYYTSTTDISADGRNILAVLNTGAQRFITPGGTYSLTGTGLASELSGDGQTLVGGQSGSNPQRWRLAAAAGTSIPSENFPWPGGPVAFGNAIGTNGNGSVAALTSPTVSVVGAFGRVTAQSTFTAVSIGASAGAYRGLAANAPVMAILGSVPGNPTNAYRWDYLASTISPLNMPAGASSLSLPTGNSTISADGGVIVGNATIGAPSFPYWWDAAGTAHAVATLPTSIITQANCVNGSGTLLGGFANFPLSVRHAFVYSIADGAAYDLHNLFSAAGLLPTGWTLTATQSISNDGSRFFCLATAQDGSTRTMVLDGDFRVPAPGAGVVLGMAGVVGMGRRRRGN